jgi:radical SAM protein with 4Fe4S-binding SPASM domain
VIELDKPDLSGEECEEAEMDHAFCHTGDDGFFAKCIKGRRDFHVDPYGQMTFCSFIKDPQMRYDLRNGSFREAWEVFIPSLSNRIKGGGEYLETCGSCELRSHCRWCPVYGYLECGRYSAPVKYLCAVAEQNRKFKEDWEKNHRQYFDCAGITIRIESDLPMDEEILHPTFRLFQVRKPQGPRKEMIAIRKHSELPYLADQDLGEIIFRKGQWTVRRKEDSWIYLNYAKEKMRETRERRKAGRGMDRCKKWWFLAPTIPG